MADRAFRSVDTRSIRRCAAAGRKAGTVRQDIDIPIRKVRGTDRLSEFWRLRKYDACKERQRYDDEHCTKSTRTHS